MSINSAFYSGTGAAFAAAGDLAFPVTIVKRNEVYDWTTSSTTVNEVRIESRAIRFESSQAPGSPVKASLVIDWRDRPESIDPSDVIEFGGKIHRFSNLNNYTYFYQVELVT